MPVAYEQRTRDDLYELATHRNIEGRSGMSKDELIAALRGESADQRPETPGQEPTDQPGDGPQTGSAPPSDASTDAGSRQTDQRDVGAFRTADDLATRTEDQLDKPEVVENFRILSHPYDRYFILELDTGKKKPRQFRINDPELLFREASQNIQNVR